MNTKLLITIDTEEDWQGPGEVLEPAFKNIYQIPELQRTTFDTFNLRPVYLVTFSVATDLKNVLILKEIYDSGRCEIGAHLHSWFVPPVEQKDVFNKVFQFSLPRYIEKQKIETLTRVIEENFKVRPVTFRAGRWGADGETIEILSELGYKVDVSVLPLVDSRKEGGMNFMNVPFEPYYPDFNDITRSSQRGGNSNVLEIPPTNGFSGRDFEGARVWYRRALGFSRRLHIVGFLDQLGIVRRLALCPERNNFQEMRILVDCCLARRSDVLHLTFHSSMISVGHSPYAHNEKEMQRRLRDLNNILDYIVNKKKVKSSTASEIYEERKG